MPNILYLNI